MKHASPRHLPARSVAAIIAGALTLLLVAPQTGAERRLSLRQAVDLALQQNRELKIEGAKVQAAEAQRKAMRGMYGPQVTLDASLMVWDSAMAFDLGVPSLSMADLADPAKFQAFVDRYGLTNDEVQSLMTNGTLLSAMFKLFDMGNIRDQVTADIKVTVAQPLTPLVQIYKGNKALSHLERAARLDRRSKEGDVVHQVTAAYLGLMQGSRFVGIARTGVQQVQAHLEQAEKYHQAGLIGRQEMLKARVELARARERVVQAELGVSLAQSGLAMLLGLSPTEVVTPTEQVTDPPPAVTASLDDCVRRALSRRPELSAMDQRREAARAGQDSAFWDVFLPQLSAVAVYNHTEGQGTLMPKDAFFAGGVLSWNLWSWGNKYYAMEAAKAETRQAELGQKLLRDGVVLEVKRAYDTLRATEAALKVARAAIAEAKESFRIETRRFEANDNTSTDVLDARLALTRAESSYVTSLYAHYSALAALERAVGAPVTGRN